MNVEEAILELDIEQTIKELAIVCGYLQQELSIANDKLKKIEEYFNKDVKEELNYLYQKNDDFFKGKDYGDKGYGASIQSVQAIRDNILSIIEGND